jgi:hypothetical protein
MNRLTKCLSGALLLSLAACATYELPAGDHVGLDMKPRQPVAFATVDASPSDYFDRTVLVEATATAVCATAGCWMQIEDQGKTALVRWETGCGGEYAFPKGVEGKRILVQGSFYPKTLSPEDLEHMQEEAGREVEIEAEGYEFNASAVLVVDETAIASN